MASEEKIRRTIIEISNRPRNVVIEDIDWVMKQLQKFGPVEIDENVHQRLYTFKGERFSVCPHHPGQKQIKLVYVKNFLAAMMKVGWYE